MSLTKAELIDIPGGPGVTGGIVAGSGFTTNAEGQLILTGTGTAVTKLIAGPGIQISPVSGIGQVTVTYAGAAAGTFASGTTMAFYQGAAPIGWRRVSTVDDAAIRIVSTTSGGSTGGSYGFSTVWKSYTPSGFTILNASTPPQNTTSVSISATATTTWATDRSSNTTINSSTMATHPHGTAGGGDGGTWNFNTGGTFRKAGDPNTSTSAGSSNSHNHPVSGSVSLTPQNSTHLHQVAFNGETDPLTITGVPLDLTLSYADVIICKKD